MPEPYEFLESFRHSYIVLDDAHRIVFANAAARAFLKPEPTNMPLALAWSDALDRHQSDRLQTVVDEVVASGMPQSAAFSGTDWRVELLRLRQEGASSERLLRLSPVTLLTDVPPSISLLETEAILLQLAVDAAEIGTFYCPMPLHAIYWNRKCKEHFWLPADATVDFDLFYARLHPDDRERTRAAVEAAVYDAQLYDIEYRTVSPQGEVRWIRAKGKTRYSAGGEPLQFDGITIDISHQKSVERERDQLLEEERARRELAQSESSLKDMLIATVSHELRTPLNATKAWVEVLKSRVGDPAGVKKCIEMLERGIEAQTRLVNDLLDINRVTSDKLFVERAPLQIELLVDAEVQSWRPMAESRQVELRFCPADGGWISGDADRIRQVLANLLSNALRFTPPGGHVEVRLEREAENIRVVVADNGKGIPHESLEAIFLPFAQLNASRGTEHGGLGLGLAIARKLALLHGGTLTAESAGEGHGAIFILTFPLCFVKQ
ncbi:PAS domain-containing sensor histidine kinase [Ralstonia pickettii]|uniref:sensor histidine kinase n=1 Tax=Ralstonia pickettii TaxID=329 RepID=UPI002714A851|nr:ATP-binding protein [Ralstonia pickettii]WKZ86465.1 PAS domain-containing sensor histidine kinase [Ralstonia pickettii]